MGGLVKLIITFVHFFLASCKYELHDTSFFLQFLLSTHTCAMCVGGEGGRRRLHLLICVIVAGGIYMTVYR